MTAGATIDLAQIKRYLDWVQNLTGLERRIFDLDIIADTQVEGTVGGLPFNDQFSNTLHFKLDEIQLYIAEDSPIGETSDPLAPVRTGFIPRQSVINNNLSILGVNLSVRQARQIALTVGSASLLLIALILAPTLAVSLRSETERIKLLHAERLLDVNELPSDKDLDWVQVASIDDLVKLSESTGGLILHSCEVHNHIYILKDGTIGYRLEIHDPNGSEPGGTAKIDLGDD